MKYIVAGLFLSSIAYLGFIPEQSDFLKIALAFTIAFLSYYFLITKTDLKLRHALGLAVLTRFILVFAFPNLSDDIYRFIWDGELLHIGENPFAYLPSDYVKNEGVKSVFIEIYPYLNSPNYYSIYPPFAQLVFYISTVPFLNPSLTIKALLFLAEIGTIYFILELLKSHNMDSRKVLWYALNPLIIIEVMGNIHFEGFMVFFFVLFLYFLKNESLNKAAVCIALAIGAKLLPLLFLPYFLFRWKLSKVLIFYLKVGLVLGIIFLPMILQLGGFTDSLDLYFRKFEFNASFYYVFRELGELWKGYNMIAKIGPWMAVSVFVIVFYLAHKVKDFYLFSLFALTCFLFLSTTVHPWYLALGILLSIFAKKNYFLLWSALIILSYSKYGLSESLYYISVAIEYLLVLSFLLFEIITLRQNLRSAS